MTCTVFNMVVYDTKCAWEGNRSNFPGQTNSKSEQTHPTSGCTQLCDCCFVIANRVLDRSMASARPSQQKQIIDRQPLVDGNHSPALPACPWNRKQWIWHVRDMVMPILAYAWPHTWWEKCGEGAGDRWDVTAQQALQCLGKEEPLGRRFAWCRVLRLVDDDGSWKWASSVHIHMVIVYLLSIEAIHVENLHLLHYGALSGLPSTFKDIRKYI